MKQYRVQYSDHQGVVNRAFGGRVSSWGKWITALASEDRQAAETYFDTHSRRGLRRWRVVFGAEVLRKSD